MISLVSRKYHQNFLYWNHFFFWSCYSMDETKIVLWKKLLFFQISCFSPPFIWHYYPFHKGRELKKKIRKPWLLSHPLPYNVEGNVFNPSEMHFGKKKNSISFFKNLVWGLNTTMTICYPSNSEAGNRYLWGIFQIWLDHRITMVTSTISVSLKKVLGSGCGSFFIVLSFPFGDLRFWFRSGAQPASTSARSGRSQLCRKSRDWVTIPRYGWLPWNSLTLGQLP